MDLSAEIAGLRIDPAIMNGAGIFSYPPTLKRVSRYLGAVVAKSTGIKSREGNETPVNT